MLTRLPLTYTGETIGELVVATRAPGEPLTPADQRLLSDLARQIGVAAHAIVLAADLDRARLRIVAAREETRRRLKQRSARWGRASSSPGWPAELSGACMCWKNTTRRRRADCCRSDAAAEHRDRAGARAGPPAASARAGAARPGRGAARTRPNTHWPRSSVTRRIHCRRCPPPSRPPPTSSPSKC